MQDAFPLGIGNAAMVCCDISNLATGSAALLLIITLIVNCLLCCVSVRWPYVLQQSQILDRMYHVHLVKYFVFPHYLFIIYFVLPRVFCEL